MLGFLNNKNKKPIKKYKIKSMSIASIVLIGYRNIFVNKLRSFLTIGGVAIGIGVVTFLICLGFGMQKMVINEVTKNNPENIIDINNGNLDNFVSLNKENVNKIKNIPGVVDIAVEVNTGGKVYYQESQTDVIIFGVTDNFLKLININMKYGKMDDPDRNNKIIISKKLASILGFSNGEDVVGKKVNFDIILSDETNSGKRDGIQNNNNEAEVIGVTDNEDSVVAYFYYDFLRDKFGIDLAQTGKATVDMKTKSIEEIRKNIEILGFVTESVVDVVTDINMFFLVIRVVLIVFGTIIMSISAMGMLNTLSVSLLQRTKEVGILKALGAKRIDIFRMFVFEAAIISFVGGALGFAGGYGFAELINLVFNFFSAKRGMAPIDFIYIPGYFILALVCFIGFLGLVTGIMPAKRAATIHALDALRYE
ncbi:MAG: ABC transporter permease [Parcubacteria group bacterium]|jgi:putative ABC transport system permease protein